MLPVETAAAIAKTAWEQPTQNERLSNAGDRQHATRVCSGFLPSPTR
jgi:hypothetical protein